MLYLDDAYWNRRKRREDEFASLVVMVSELPTDIIICILSRLDRMRAMALSWSCGPIRRASMTPSLWKLVKMHDLETCAWVVGVPWPLVRDVIISHREDCDSDMPDAAHQLVRDRRASHVNFHFDGFWILPWGTFRFAFDNRRVTFESLELEIDDLRAARVDMNWALVSAACGHISIRTDMEEAEFDEFDPDEYVEWMDTTVADNDSLKSLSVRVQYSYWNGGIARFDREWFEISNGM